MSALLEAGVTLEKTLTIIASHNDQKTSFVFSKIKNLVKEGHSFASALSNFPADFSSVYIGLVSVGEASGNLSFVLKKLAIFLESNNSLKQGILSAITYPIIVTMISLGIVAVLMTYVVPEVVNVLVSYDRELPILTKILIWFSNFFFKWGILLTILIIFIFTLFLVLYFSIHKIRFVVDSILTKLPIIGGFIKLGESVLLASTLHIAISGGVSMIKSLKISAKVVKNTFLKNQLYEVIESVKEGAELGRSLSRFTQFSPLLIQLISTGEKSGKLSGMLEVVVSELTKQLKHKALRLTLILEPLMILFTGLIVLLIVLAVMMPLIEINSII